jgi:ABC transporter DrrB family efflux protein
MTAITATAPVASPPAARATWWTDTRVYAARNIRHIREIPEKLLDVTVQPLMFVLLFAYVFGGAIAVQGSNYREYLIAGILVQSLAFGMAGPATAIATDLTEGVIDRFRSLPTARSAYLSGHALAELAGLGLSIVILLGSGLIVGWRTHTDPLHVAAALGLLVLFAATMVVAGTLLGLIVRAPDAVMGIAFTVIFPLTFISNAFVPIESMPTALQNIAAWNPISALTAAVRQLFGNPSAPVTVHSWPLEHPVIAGVGYCVLALAICIPLCLRRYKARTTD